MSLQISGDFNEPVDLQAYPDYLLQNPYPIDFALIRARLANGFYRQLAAVQFDLRCLRDNAVRYNLADSSIVRNAETIWQMCRAFFPDLETPPQVSGGHGLFVCSPNDYYIVPMIVLSVINLTNAELMYPFWSFSLKQG